MHREHLGKKVLLCMALGVVLFVAPRYAYAYAGISFVGQVSAVGTSATLPTFSPGDLAVVFAYNTGGGAPSLPSGWTNINSANNYSYAHRAGYRILQAGDTTTGTWTNATEVVVLVYRGADSADPIGAIATKTGSNSTFTYPALTLQNTDGSSWVLGYVGADVSTVTTSPPTGMTNRASLSNSGSAGGYIAGDDTNGGVSAWTQKTASAGVATNWRSIVIEVLPAPVAPAVTTGSATSITSNGATFNGTITATGHENETDSGFAWGTDPTLESAATTSAGAQTGAVSFGASISGLNYTTTYYFRAYVTNSVGTSYGSIESFTTGVDTTPSRQMRLFEGYKIKFASGRIILYGTPLAEHRIYLTTTGAGTWTVPSDWNSSDNTIEVIGGGGGGTGNPGGGGGGAYAKAVNVTLTPDSTVSYSVGAGGAGGNSSGTAGGDTYFCDSISGCTALSDTAVVAGAQGGAGDTGSGGAGGVASSGVGSTKYSGGAGNEGSKYGGGGAAGPNGAGGSGASGVAGGAGDNGSGGAGGASSGSNGGAGTEWDSTHGAGGGGAGLSGFSGSPGAGGSYGGGGGGNNGFFSGNGAAGAQGLIVITYYTSS